MPKKRHKLKKLWKLFLKHLKKDFKLLLLLLFLSAGLTSVVFLNFLDQDIRQSADQGPATITFVPNNANPVAGEEVNVDIFLNTKDRSIVGIQLLTKLIGTLPSDFAIHPQTIEGLTLLKDSIEAVESHHLLSLVFYLSNPETPFTTTNQALKIATLTFTVPESGELTFDFDTFPATKLPEMDTAADILTPISNFTYTFTNSQPTNTDEPTSSDDPTSTDSATPEDNPPTDPPSQSNNRLNKLTLIGQFSGVNSDQGPIITFINLGIGNSTSPVVSTTAVFNFDPDTKHYQAILDLSPFQLLTTDTYWLTVKGEKHLKRAFPDLSLTSNHTLDLTDYPFLPGDISGQDGKLDANDINIILNAISKGVQTLDDLNNADVNYDGRVNSIDLGLIIKSLASTN